MSGGVAPGREQKAPCSSSGFQPHSAFPDSFFRLHPGSLSFDFPSVHPKIKMNNNKTQAGSAQGMSVSECCQLQQMLLGDETGNNRKICPLQAMEKSSAAGGTERN